MDYTDQPFLFKIKKFLRYVKLYGISRTIVKVKGQYHMNMVFNILPKVSQSGSQRQHVGLIGCGNFGFSNIAYYLKGTYGNVLRGAMDINVNRAASLHKNYNTSYFTTLARDIIDDQQIDLIYIASNHSSHTDYAIQALKNGKAVHIEKPHAVSIFQLVMLCKTIIEESGVVRLGFNRPKSKLGRLVIEELQKESGATMLNWFIAGHKIDPDHWYFAPEEGGRILGNLCHWTDLVYQMVGGKKYPVTIIPARADKSDCDISVSMVFADHSIASITFSAKGHTFEGVRETLNAHKGNVLIELKDFQKLRIDNIDEVKKIRLARRDHGHKAAVINSYLMANRPDLAEDISYIWNTGYLALKVKEALETNQKVIVEDFDISYPFELAGLNPESFEADYSKP
jgi:predicted dehydrogenase